MMQPNKKYLCISRVKVNVDVSERGKLCTSSRTSLCNKICNVIVFVDFLWCSAHDPCFKGVHISDREIG